MPVTITAKTPSFTQVAVGWQSAPAANNTSTVRVATSSANLDNPGTRITQVSDQDGQLPGITDFTATVTGLTQGTTYWLQCEADGVLSSKTTFTTSTITATILSINPSDTQATIHWQANTTVLTAECYVATSQANLSNPAKRTTVQGVVPDIDFQVDNPDINNGQAPLTPGTTYWCQCMAGGVLSAAQTFKTTGIAPTPPGPSALPEGHPVFVNSIAGNANGRQLVRIYEGSLVVCVKSCYVGAWNGDVTNKAVAYGNLWYNAIPDTDGMLYINISLASQGKEN